ncbi:hypothetical protein [Caldanaerobius polysaccharolyticus]|uniref:hypothetical protein n=1 Tax=Caldanaerobius polysaccharolyticus TaxID=44256 RepID=UPI00047A5561|nr:hypothetical protein [Caldanaerobius polysaccharolyticus]
MAYDVPLRSTLEKAGYKVTWQGVGQPIKIEKEGQTYDISPSNYQLRGGKAYLDSSVLPGLMEKAGYQWVREAIPQGAGYQYNYNSKTGQVTVSHPFGGSYTFTNPIVAGGRAYVSPSEAQTAKSVVGPPYETGLAEVEKLWSDYSTKQQEAISKHYAYQDQLLKDYMNQINNFTKQYGDAALAMLNTYQQYYQQALQQLQKLMTPDTTVPETVKVSLSILQKNLQDNLQQLNEEMNRRGIYQSGLAAEMERKMREGELTEEQKILAQWLDDVHQRAYDAALRYADYLTKYASGLADMYGTAYLKPIELAQQAAKEAYTLTSGLAENRFKAESDLQAQGFDVLSKLRQTAAEQAQKIAETLRQRQWDLEDWERQRKAALEDWQRQRQAALEDWQRQRQAEKEDQASSAALQRELLEKRLQAERQNLERQLQVERELAQMKNTSSSSSNDAWLSELLQILGQ